MYVAVKGGETAIANAHAWLDEARRGDPAVPELTTDQVAEQLTLAVDRAMSEGSLYDPGLGALAVKQARGDGIEAIRLLRERFNRATPALLITADRSAELRATALGHDIQMQHKPVKPAALRAYLTQVASVRSLAAE